MRPASTVEFGVVLDPPGPAAGGGGQIPSRSSGPRCNRAGIVGAFDCLYKAIGGPGGLQLLRGPDIVHFQVSI